MVQYLEKNGQDLRKKSLCLDFKKRAWISLEEEESFSSWIALPGHKNLGLGRHWHFFSIIFWIANGAAYYILLFTSDEWQRLVPTSWSIFPQAFQTVLYASFHFTVCQVILMTLYNNWHTLVWCLYLGHS